MIIAGCLLSFVVFLSAELMGPVWTGSRNVIEFIHLRPCSIFKRIYLFTDVLFIFTSPHIFFYCCYYFNLADFSNNYFTRYLSPIYADEHVYCILKSTKPTMVTGRACARKFPINFLKWFFFFFVYTFSLKCIFFYMHII